MKEMIQKKLKEVVGLTDEQAAKAADVVIDLINSDAAKGLTDKLGGLAGGLGGMLGGDKDKDGE
ncbi:MAG: hypothetical protein AAF411_05790 [Myxococcota bacterium]